MNNINGILLTIVILIGIVIGAYFANSFLVLERQKAENQAKSDCAMANRYEVVTEDATISYPPQDLYEKCLDEKGL